MANNLADSLCTSQVSLREDIERLGELEARLRPKAGFRYIGPSNTQIHSALVASAKMASCSLELNDADFQKFFSDNRKAMEIQVKATAYTIGLAPIQFRRYAWVRRQAIADLTRSALDNLKAGLLLPSLINVRSALEQIGNAFFIRADVKEFHDSHYATPTLWSSALVEVLAKLHERAFGTRIDWKTYLESPFSTGKTKSYQPVAGFMDMEANKLLHGVDALDKTVRGTRMCYEFLCEFAHPNAGVFFLSLFCKDVVRRDSPFIFIDTTLASNFPSYAVGLLAPRIADVFSIYCQAIEELLVVLGEYDRAAREIEKRAKPVLKTVIGNCSSLWELQEPCPCLSGKPVGSCCGKAIVRTPH